MTQQESNNNTRKSNPQEQIQFNWYLENCNNNTRISNPQEQLVLQKRFYICNNNTRKSNPQELAKQGNAKRLVITIRENRILKNWHNYYKFIVLVITIRENRILKNK